MPNRVPWTERTFSFVSANPCASSTCALVHAEHDGYHMARMQALIRRFTGAPVV